MNYESMLNDDFKKVKLVEGLDRFEILKVSGHREGSRTIVTNFSQVVSGLRRPSEHLVRFLSRELASPGEISNDRLIFLGKPSSKAINEKIEKYANEFVKCKNCGKPDTELTDEGGKTVMRCMACGTKRVVHDI